MTESADPPADEQPEPEASSDGDRSWTADAEPLADPELDRSVEAVIARQAAPEPDPPAV